MSRQICVFIVRMPRSGCGAASDARGRNHLLPSAPSAPARAAPTNVPHGRRHKNSPSSSVARFSGRRPQIALATATRALTRSANILPGRGQAAHEHAGVRARDRRLRRTRLPWLRDLAAHLGAGVRAQPLGEW